MTAVDLSPILVGRQQVCCPARRISRCSPRLLSRLKRWADGTSIFEEEKPQKRVRLQKHMLFRCRYQPSVRTTCEVEQNGEDSPEHLSLHCGIFVHGALGPRRFIVLGCFKSTLDRLELQPASRLKGESGGHGEIWWSANDDCSANNYCS